MKVLLEAADAYVVATAPAMPLVRHALAQFRISVLIAAASEWQAALNLAWESAVPLLLVAANRDEGLMVLRLSEHEAQDAPSVSVIVDDDLDPQELQHVLDEIVGGGRYTDRSTGL